MGFILKIYMIGLIAFVPSHDGRQMTVLLVNAGEGFQTSDGSIFPPHYPVLLASAAHCKGRCSREVETIAPHVYVQTSDSVDPHPVFPSSPNPAESLRRLVAGGGAWALTGSQISFSHPAGRGKVSAAKGMQVVQGRRSAQMRGAGPLAAMPADPEQKEDFSWVVEMDKVSPAAGKIDPDCLSPHPARCPVASRLTVSEGTFKTYKLAEFMPPAGGGGVAEFIFQPMAVKGPASGFTQAIADWTAVEIQVPSCEVTFTARPFDGKGRERRIKLSPATCDGKGIVEVALLNLPDPSQFGASEAHAHAERTGDGSHFEFFYELSQNRPDPAHRPIPKVTGNYLLAATVGQESESSPLLSEYNLPRAGTASRPICTQALFESQ